MKKNQASFRRDTLLAMVLVGTLPVLILAIVSATVISYQVRREQLQRDLALTVQIGRQIEGVISGAIQDLEILATNPILTGSEVSDDARKIELSRITRPNLPELSLLDKSGFIIESTGQVSELQEYSPWFTSAASKQRTIVSNPYRLQNSEELFISFYIPVPRAKKSNTSVIKATMSFDRFGEILGSIEPKGSDFLALVDGRGNILVTTDGQLPLQHLKEIGIQNRQGLDRSGSCQLEDGRAFFFSLREVRPPNQLDFTRTWMLAYFREPGGVMSIIYQSYRYQALATAFGLLLSACLGWFFTRRLLGPASRLHQSDSVDHDNVIKLDEAANSDDDQKGDKLRNSTGNHKA